MTGRMIKLECSKAFHTKGFYTALLIGLAIVAYHMYEEYYIGNLTNGEDLQIGVYYTGSCFGQWMGIDSSDICGRLYTLLIPLLATLPYGASYNEDRHSGYLKQILARSGMKSYLWSKWAAVFISGATVVMIPLIVDFIGVAMKAPIRNPVSLVSTMAPFENSWIVLYHHHPLLYTLFFILMDGIVGGSIAALSLAVSRLSHSAFTAWAFPMLAVLMANYLLSPLNLGQWNPVQFMYPGYSILLDLKIVMIELSAAAVLVFLLFIVRRPSQDIL